MALDFTKLVEKYSKRVMNTAYGVVGNWQAAMDVHQDVFLAIWKRWHTYNGETNWDGYLYRTTIRKALDFAKKSRREKRLDPEIGNTIEGHFNCEDNLRMEELLKKLRKSLDQLPEQQAQAFVMSRIEGLTYEEIASALNCSQSTARVHVHRAVKQLAELMRDDLVKADIQ